MSMKKPTSIVFLILCISMLLTIVYSGCLGQENIQLDAVEIREYQGEKLSSVNDFRENSIKGPQQINKSNYQLIITGLVKNPKTYTYDEIINTFQHYKKVVTLDCVEGWSVKILWEGLLIKDILTEVQPNLTASTIIFKAYDGYSTSFPLNYTTDNNIMLAYKMNNATIPPERGFPFQLVAESKWGYKWIKWVTEIELSDNLNYKGYWESRGYSNSGNLNDSFFDK
ncbi:MAG TPA: molybdopterin-dependent oxidoreductase [Candidatus Thermoplasmatota archaeon]|nr:molybdopterin-dependent oxidoreductase [Candidatus Thermoplasmatota archaeon]